MVRNKIKMFAQKKLTLPPGRHKIVILDEADRSASLLHTHLLLRPTAAILYLQAMSLACLCDPSSFACTCLASRLTSVNIV